MLPKISIFGFELKTQFILRIIGIFFSFLYYLFVRKKYFIDGYKSIIIISLIFIFEIIGAKILYVIENIKNFNVNLLFNGGMSLFGVFLFSPLLFLVLGKIVNKTFYDIMCFIAPGIIIELIFYRIGCFCAGCCMGIESNYGVLFPDGTKYLPVQLYEVMLNIILLIILFLLKRKNILKVTFPFVYIYYSIVRFVLEFLRIRNNIFLCFSLSHSLSLLTLLIGIISSLYYLKYKKS